MFEGPVWGREIGPTAEWLVFINEHHRQTELLFFWSMVEALIVSFPGTYEDVPPLFTEQGTELLLSNP